MENYWPEAESPVRPRRTLNRFAKVRILAAAPPEGAIYVGTISRFQPLSLYLSNCALQVAGLPRDAAVTVKPFS